MHLEQENHTPHQDQIDQEVQDYVWDHSYFMKRPPAQDVQDYRVIQGKLDETKQLFQTENNQWGSKL